ncbi:MAG TPA: DsbA family protein [Opitutaceae bacterium]|nr:DsbA family protein [Opitutaceae bacterium]
MKVTYYLEILSSWCYWAEPAWAELKEKFGSRVEFDWKIALMKPDAFPVSTSQCEWFYQRSGTVMRSPFKLDAGWFEVSRKGDYRAPNFVAEAARELGVRDDRVRLALMHAAMREGKKIGDLSLSAEIAAAASGLAVDKLIAGAKSDAVQKRVEASTAVFFAHQIDQRPAFILEDEIGDKAVFSGLAKSKALSAAIEAMLEDTAAYTTHRVHFGPPPTV